MMKRSLVLVIGIGVTIASLFMATSFLFAATTLETVVGECQKRTGFSDTTCQTLVKKYMNVDRCIEYTGYSAAECTSKIQELTQETGDITQPSSLPPTNTAPVQHDVTALPPLSLLSDGSLMGIRAKKERDVLALWKRTEALTKALKEQGVDVQTIESAFPEFEQRAETLLATYDTYRSVYEGTTQGAPIVRDALRSDARRKVNDAKDSLIQYYRSRILGPLQASYNKQA